MHETEVELFSAFLRYASSYFEFGMGGSTCLAARLVRERVHAIDSDLAWVEKLREIIGKSSKEIVLDAVDIGKTGEWGTPVGRDSEHLFPDYSLAITKTGFRDYDLCLVDGRFRVACVLQAIEYLQSDAIIAIHDYLSRPHYHIIEEFARPIAGTGQLRFFTRRKGIDPAKFQEVLLQYRYNPD